MKKMQNKPQATNPHKTILASIFAFIALSVLYLLVTASMRGTIAPTRDTQEQAPSSSQAQVTDTTSKDGMKTYRSDFMKIEFEYPNGFMINGQLTDVKISKEGGGEIAMSKYGTDYANASEHVNSLIKNNHLTIVNRFDISEPYDGVIYKISSDGVEKLTAMFVKNYSAYYFSTKDPSLFPDLETIAKSFKILD